MLGFQYANATRLFFGREAEKGLVGRLADDLGHEATSSSSTAEARSSARDCFPA